MNKRFLRERNKLLRKNLDIKKISSIIVSKIKNFDIFLNANNILIFYPMKYEINLLDLLDFKDKFFYLPKVNKNDLLICPYSLNLAKSNFGVMEPKDNIFFDISKIDVVFTPCLCVDKNLNRIGYGMGYYDRLFQNPNFRAYKVGVLPKELMVDEIKNETFDIPLDFLITDWF